MGNVTLPKYYSFDETFPNATFPAGLCLKRTAAACGHHQPILTTAIINKQRKESDLCNY